MTWPWRSPQATRQALSARIKDRYPPRERQQRIQEVAYRRLLARLFDLQPHRWVVKGGVALLLRLDPNRTSNDIDLAYVADAGEHAVAVEALVAAASHDLGDFFAFEVGSDRVEEVDAGHPLERAVSVPVFASIGQTPFAEFSVDLALPRVDDLAVDWVETDARLTGERVVDEIPAVAVLALPAQVADKVCATFERHGPAKAPSSRARDLADIAMIALQKDIDGTALTGDVEREARRRLDAGTLIARLPASLDLADEQLVDWHGRWDKATRGAPISFEESLEIAKRFIDPVLAGDAAARRWVAADQGWR